MKANPTRWMANPYAGEGVPMALRRELERLHVDGSGTTYLAYGAHDDEAARRIDGTTYFYRDTSELADERETFEDLLQTQAR